MNSLKLASVLCLAALCALVLPVSSPILAQTQGDLVGSGKTIFIDPGHGGQETGAVHVGQDGKVDLIERDVNLSIGLKLRALLEKDGFKVAMSRTTAASPNDPPIDRNDDGRVNNRDQYQAVDDLANESGADLMVSIHNNGSPNEEASGTEVWFSPLRPFADKNLLIASLLQANLVSSIRNAGYDTLDRGIKDDSNYRVYRGRVFEIFVLGQADESTHHPRAAKMPAALGESLFLTNEADAAMLAQDRIQDAIAQGYHDAIVQYFARLAEGTPLEWPVPAIGASYAPPAAEPTPTPTPTPEPGWRRPRPVQMF